MKSGLSFFDEKKIKLSTSNAGLRQIRCGITITVSDRHSPKDIGGSILKDIIKEVAKAHKMSEQEVRNEMRVAIREAMKSTDPTAQAFWKQIAPDGKEPPVEKVIASISLMVQENKLCS
ncbi:MAG: sporulation initiation factor Spo0A C-terminal domain-containing protein [Acutalibacteraceae bacterium]